MTIARMIEITPEERKLIRDVIKKKRFTLRELSRRVDIVSYSFINAILHGQKSTFTSDLAIKFYEILDDESLSFLLHPHVLVPQQNSSLEEEWKSIYTTLSNRLRTLYDNQPSAKKGEIIGELENLVEKYKQ